MTSVQLIKQDISIPWGFRLQGGKDFGAPLTVQRINPGSVAAKCGLQIGDVIISINDTPTAGLKHKDAQDIILKGETKIQLLVNRGGVSGIGSQSVDKSVPRTPVFYDPPKRNPDGFGVAAAPNTASYPFQSYAKTPEQPKSSDYVKSYDQPKSSDHLKSYDQMKSYNQSADIKDSSDPSVKYVPSTTCKLVRDLDAGNDIGVNPLTGVQIRTSPAQSKLHHMLEKQCLVSGDSDADSKSGNAGIGRPEDNGNGSKLQGSSSRHTVGSTVAPVSLATARPSHSPVSSRAHVVKDEAKESNQTSRPGNTDIVQKLSSVSRIPVCHVCNETVTGQYMTVMGKIWCRLHFICHSCGKSLLNVEFFEDSGNLYCHEDYEQMFAPRCAKCDKPIVEEVVKAMGKTFHVSCFLCEKCMKPIQAGSYHLNQGKPYCQKDWELLFQTKCHSCQFAIEPGDQWIDALGSHWHAECFNCCVCKKNMESVGFCNKNGHPCCKDHN